MKEPNEEEEEMERTVNTYQIYEENSIMYEKVIRRVQGKWSHLIKIIFFQLKY